MKPFERILFPIDFSTRCQQTSCTVGEIARTLGSELVLLHVFEGYDALELGVGSRSNEDEVYKRLVEARGRRLGEFAAGCFNGVNVRRIVRCGVAEECIVNVAHEENIQLIVMPTHGEGRFRRLLAGSVTLKVLHDAECAVWTTAHAEALPSHPPLHIRKILCAVDMTPDSTNVLKTAAHLAWLFDSALYTVHAIPASERIRQQDTVKALTAITENAVRSVSGQGEENAMPFDVRVEIGHISNVVHELAVTLKADIVIAGHGHARRRFGELWSHLGTMIHESPCSVLSI